MSLPHFLLTRLNIRAKFAGTAEVGVSDEWFDNRLKIFQRFTLPSVKAQTRQSFSWVIFMDEQSEEDKVLRVKALLPDNALILFCSPDKSPKAALNEHLVNYDGSHIITSRLDSDDALMDSYIQSTQNTANSLSFPLNKTVIDRRRIYYVSTEKKQFFKTESLHSTAFCSLVERRDVIFDTANAYPHHLIHKLFPTVNLENPEALVVIHGANTSSQLGSFNVKLNLRRLLKCQRPVPRVRKIRNSELLAGSFGEGVAAHFSKAEP